MILDYKGKRLSAFSDTHGRHRDLSIPQSADILVCAGDVVSDFQENGLEDFLDWFSSCPAKLRLFIPGNHEVIFDICPEETRYLIPANITLLEDCGIEYEGITFYSISSRKIQQMEWIGEECGLSVDTDFLITHIPPRKECWMRVQGAKYWHIQFSNNIRSFIFLAMCIPKEGNAKERGEQHLSMSLYFKHYIKKDVSV